MTKDALWALVALAVSFQPATAADQGCMEIAPDADALAAPVVDTSVTAGRSAACLPGAANGRGDVALGTRDANGRPDMGWTVKPPGGGASLGRFFGPNVTTLLPQEDGWIGGSEWGFELMSPPEIYGWSSTGDLLHESRLPANRIAPDFTSGAVVAFGTEDPPWQVLVQRFGSGAAPRSGPVLVARVSYPVAVGVDTDRDALVLFDGSAAGLPADHLGGRWFDPCGAALTEVFDTGVARPLGTSSGTLAPLYDGSLALQLDGQWVARFAPRSTDLAGPAPAWLAAQPDTRLVWIRQGKGYALIPKAGDVAECRQQILLYTKAGQSCGGVTFTVDGLPCTTSEINVGPDGTVVQLSPRNLCLDPTCSSFRCSYSWWPGLLGGHGHAGGGVRPAPRCR
ncbi:MAG TPA: hypothetical protein VND93_17815 [Myxococcales bacterium]|nr:hypothetical protein [Myxococcales bacterium]